MKQSIRRMLSMAGIVLLCSATLLCRAAGAAEGRKAEPWISEEEFSIQEFSVKEFGTKKAADMAGASEKVCGSSGGSLEEACYSEAKVVSENQPEELPEEPWDKMNGGPAVPDGDDAGTGPFEVETAEDKNFEEEIPWDEITEDEISENEILGDETAEAESSGMGDSEAETVDFETVVDAAGEAGPEEAVPQDRCIRHTIYHRHTGNSESGGGCHGSRREWTTTETKRCNNKLRPSGGSEKGKGVCDACGGYSSRSSGTCGRVKESKSVTHVAYDQNCGKTENTPLAELTLTWDTSEWSRSVLLKGEYKLLAEGCQVDKEPYIWNEGIPSAAGELEVLENDVYTLRLKMDDNCNSQDAVISYRVGNVDRTAPTMITIDWEKENFVREAVVTVTAEDWQPEPGGNDGPDNSLAQSGDPGPEGRSAGKSGQGRTPGCGLHKKSYSFDGGKSWQEGNQAALKNGVYQIAVRDRLGNTQRQEIIIDHVDDRGPAILSVQKDPSYWTRRNVTVSVTAVDLQQDLPGLAGGETGQGSGLHDEAYSFDGGRTFTADSSYCAKENEKLELVVRDRLGQESRETVEVNNIDRINPHIRIRQEPEHWSGGRAVLSVQAHDEESGLPERPYSFDGGTSWTYRTKLEVDTPGSYRVLVRDRAGNQNYEEKVLEPEPVQPEVPVAEPPVEKPAEPAAKQSHRPVLQNEAEPTVTLAGIKLPERKAAPQSVLAGKKEAPVILQQTKQKNRLPLAVRVLLALTGLAVLLTGILLLLRVLFCRVKVYVRGEREEFRHVMTGFLYRRQGAFHLTVPDCRIRCHRYTHIKLVPNPLFVSRHEGEELFFTIEGIGTVLRVAEEIELS